VDLDDPELFALPVVEVFKVRPMLLLWRDTYLTESTEIMWSRLSDGLLLLLPSYEI
jgi:hypothetical protein